MRNALVGGGSSGIAGRSLVIGTSVGSLVVAVVAIAASLGRSGSRVGWGRGSWCLRFRGLSVVVVSLVVSVLVIGGSGWSLRRSGCSRSLSIRGLAIVGWVISLVVSLVVSLVASLVISLVVSLVIALVISLVVSVLVIATLRRSGSGGVVSLSIAVVSAVLVVSAIVSLVVTTVVSLVVTLAFSGGGGIRRRLRAGRRGGIGGGRLLLVVVAVVVVVVVVATLTLSGGRVGSISGRSALGSTFGSSRCVTRVAVGGTWSLRDGLAGTGAFGGRGGSGSRFGSRDAGRFSGSCRDTGACGGIVVVVVVGSVGRLDGEVAAVIERTVLSVGNEARLMVRSRVDGADAVYTGSKTGGHISGENVVCGNVVETLEEGKGGGVQRLGGLEVGQFFDDHMAVADDDSLAVDLLWGGIVVGGGVDKVTGLHVDNLHLDGERRVLDEALVTILGEHKLAAWGLVEADDTTHGSLIA